MARCSAMDSIKLRQRILEVAGLIIMEQGVKGLSMRALAKTVGSSPTTSYNLFGSKAGLLQEILNNDLFSDLEVLEVNPKPEDSLTQVLENIDKLEAQLLPKEKMLKSLLNGVIQARGDSELDPAVPHLRVFILSWLEVKVDEGVLLSNTPTNVLAHQMASGLLGNIYCWVANTFPCHQLVPKIKYGLMILLVNYAAPSSKENLQEKLERARLTLESVI